MDLSKIPFDASPNFGYSVYDVKGNKKRMPGRRGNAKITHIVIHTTEGGFPGCLSWMKNPKSNASCHYLVTKEGNIIQLVKDKDQSWGCLSANPFTINIEHVGYVKDAFVAVPIMWQKSVELSAELCKKYNIPVKNIIGHNDPFLVKYHADHTDPGKYWDMNKYRKDVEKQMKITTTSFFLPDIVTGLVITESGTNGHF